MTSEQIRQKAREFAQMWALKKESERLKDEGTVAYETRYLTAFAESLLSGGAAQVPWKCFHCTFETSDRAEAEAHFGDGEGDSSLCKTWAELNEDGRLAEVQSLQRELNGAREEICKLVKVRAGAVPPAASPQPHGDIRENVLKRIEAIQAMRFPQAIAEYTDRERWQLALGELLWVEWMFERAASGGRHSVIVTKNAAELLVAASGSGTPATPSTPDKLYRRIPAGEDFPHGLLQEVDISAEIAAAIAAEREECAKLAEQSLDSAFCRGSFYGQQVAAAIRSRASQPAAAQPSPKELAGRIAQRIYDWHFDPEMNPDSEPAQKWCKELAEIIEQELKR